MYIVDRLTGRIYAYSRRLSYFPHTILCVSSTHPHHIFQTRYAMVQYYNQRFGSKGWQFETRDGVTYIKRKEAV